MANVITEELLQKYNTPKAKTETFFTKVVGTTFRIKEGIDLDVVESGDFVLLDPEIGNPHDPFACRVIHDRTGTHIGYVKKETENGTLLSKEIWENTIKHGDLYVAKVEVTGGEGKNKGFNLMVKRVYVPQDGES